MLRIGVKRNNTSTGSVVEDYSSSVEPPRKRVKVSREQNRSVAASGWWGQRVWNSVVGGLSNWFRQRRRRRGNSEVGLTESVSSSAVDGSMDRTHSEPNVLSQPKDVPTQPDIGQGIPHHLPSSSSSSIKGTAPQSLTEIEPPSAALHFSSLSRYSSSQSTHSKPRERRYQHLNKADTLRSKPITNSTPFSIRTPHFTSTSHTQFSSSHTPLSASHSPLFSSSSHTHQGSSSSTSISRYHPKAGEGGRGTLFSPVLSPEVIGPSQVNQHSSHYVKVGVTSSFISADSSVCRAKPASVLPHAFGGAKRSKEAVTLLPCSSPPQSGQYSRLLDQETKYGGAKNSCQNDELRKMTSYLEKLRADHKRSLEDKKSIAEVIERKLHFHQQQRMALEDARMTRLREQLASTKVSLSEEPESVEELSPLSEEQEKRVAMATRGGSSDECLSQKFNIRISRRDLCTLTGLQWLNDEVVNFYFNLIKERSVDGSRKIHVFNSFFYPKLSQAGYSGVRRWTRKIDIFAHDLLLLPVHMGMHWTLAAIDFTTKTISYYDSLGGSNNSCLHRLRDYLVHESKDKKGVEFDLCGWSNHTPKDIPHQENGSDCGVFMCMYARYLSVDSPFSFSQERMADIRRHIMAEILEQKLF